MKKKPTLNEKIMALLTGETQVNALDFVAFLRENKVPLKSRVINVGGDGGDLPHIKPWAVFFIACDFISDDSTDDVMKEFAKKHAHVYDHYITGGECCGCGNQPGFTRSIFGKKTSICAAARCNSSIPTRKR